MKSLDINLEYLRSINPAFISINYKKLCFSCGKYCGGNGRLVFYSSEGLDKKVWHEDCGIPEWKVNGSNYHSFKNNKKFYSNPIPKPIKTIQPLSLDDFTIKIKRALKRFAREQTIMANAIHFDNDVMNYLILNDYIEENNDSYTVLQKGVVESSL